MSPGSGPPMHVHHLQEEALTVERGTMGWQRPGEAEQVAHAGETVVLLRRHAPVLERRRGRAGLQGTPAAGQSQYFLPDIHLHA